MRVAMYYANNDLRLEELPLPVIGQGELLIKVEASGICGSDVMEWYRKDKVPLVLGHEIAGIIEEVGEGVVKYKKADRIACSHHVPCNRCHYCLSGHHTVCDTLLKTNFYPGGFSEYVRLPAINVEYGVYSLPESVSFEEATFIEPLACVLRGQRIAGVGQGKNILIIGSGIAGLLHIKLARLKGAGLIVAVDINKYRQEAAKRFGADYVLDAQEDVLSNFRKVNSNRGADIVILCTTAITAIKRGLDLVDKAGVVLFFAPTDKDVSIPLSVNKLFWRTEITLTSSYAGSPQDHLEAFNLIKERKIEVSDMITHRLKLSEAGVGFRLVAEAQDSIKVIIYPQK